MPQILKNIPLNGGDPLASESVKKAITDAEKKLGDKGRIFIRKSGTEAKLRIMVEGENASQIKELTESLEKAMSA